MDELLNRTWTEGLTFPVDTKRNLVIDTINAHSYNVAQKDKEFYNALMTCDILIPDGVGAVFAMKFLFGKKIKKIAAWDFMVWELERLEKEGGSCFFLGSSQKVLDLIVKRAAVDYPHIKVGVYSPPYKPVITDEENAEMIKVVNDFRPDVLFVGMTAPKQEKWVASVVDRLDTGHIGCIGATFDFYAGTVERAPKWMVDHSLEWFYRLVREPKRMWRRYVVGNPKFLWNMLKVKLRG